MGRGYKKIDPKEGVPFTKDDPRINREGRPPKLPALDTLLAETLSEVKDRKSAMKRILEGLIRKAEKGDARCAELLMDRGYGKLKTTTDMKLNFDQLSDSEVDMIIDKLFNTQKDGQID